MDKDYENKNWVYDNILFLFGVKETDLTPYQRKEVYDWLDWLIWATKQNHGLAA